MGYDLIGDIHGCYKTLCALLENLGYSKDEQGVYKYLDPSKPRKVVFLGDLIDRGPGIREVLWCVHDMIKADQAMMVLGNHEFYAIAYHTRCRDDSTRFIRAHNARNTSLIKETLTAFESHQEEWSYLQGWLLEQPLFIDEANFRAVHACWDQSLIDQYIARYQMNTINEDILKNTAQIGSLDYVVTERLLRGVELDYPKGLLVQGRDGLDRNYFRVKFWKDNPVCYSDIAIDLDILPKYLHDQKLSADELESCVYYSRESKPLFLGHYWMSGTPCPIADNIACVDYSAVRGGLLAAYRYDNESILRADKFQYISSQEENM